MSLILIGIPLISYIFFKIIDLLSSIKWELHQNKINNKFSGYTITIITDFHKCPPSQKLKKKKKENSMLWKVNYLFLLNPIN